MCEFPKQYSDDSHNHNRTAALNIDYWGSLFETSSAEAGIFQENKANATAADTLAPCVNKLSADMGLTMQAWGFLSNTIAIFQCWDIIEIINTLCFLWNIQRFEDGTMWMNLILFSHQPVLSTMFALHIMPKGLASFKLMQLKYANGLI